MKSISGKKFAKLLESKGWILVRVNGSHHDLYENGEFCPNISSNSRKRRPEVRLAKTFYESFWNF